MDMWTGLNRLATVRGSFPAAISLPQLGLSLSVLVWLSLFNAKLFLLLLQVMLNALGCQLTY